MSCAHLSFWAKGLDGVTDLSHDKGRWWVVPGLRLPKSKIANPKSPHLCLSQEVMIIQNCPSLR